MHRFHGPQHNFPKGPFPLPHIDFMSDVTLGHELLLAYSGYNQILMRLEDQEKTTFITDRGIHCYKVIFFALKTPVQLTKG